MIKETELLDLINKEGEVFWLDRKKDRLTKIKLLRKLEEDEYDHCVHKNGYHAIKMKVSGIEFPYTRIRQFSHIESVSRFFSEEKVLVQQNESEIEEYLLEDLFKTRGEAAYRFGYNKFKRFLDKWAFDSFEEFEKCFNKLMKGDK